MKRVITNLIIVAALSVGARAWAEPARADVERALAGYENFMTPEQFEKLGEGWDRVVETVVADPAAKPLIRLRGLAALAYAKSPSAPATLRKVLAAKGKETRGAAVLEAREALKALAAIEKDAAAPELARYLEHEVPDMRLAAVQGLARVKAPAGPAALKARLAREDEPMVRQALQKALGAK